VEIPTIILPKDATHEFTRFMHHATVAKRDDRYEDYVRSLKAKGHLKDFEVFAKAEKDIRPFEIVEGDYNAFVNVGIDLALDLIIGVAVTNYATANARLGVGSSSTAWANTQTDLVTPIARVAMQSGSFPSRASHTVTFKSDFTGSTGDGAWQEWGVFNAASGATSILTRKVESLGTKSGGTWTLTTTMTLA
jgi:hypothetical protein